MPIYEFVCSNCQAEFEELAVSMKGTAKPACPKCRSRKTLKKVSLFSPQGALAEGNAPGCGMADDGTCSQGGCPFSGG